MEGAVQAGIQWFHWAALFVFSVALLAFVLELVRRGYLKERYALLWMATAAAGLAVGLVPGIIIGLAALFRVQYLTVIVALTFLFVLGLLLSFTVVISRLSARNRTLTQELALLENRVTRLENTDVPRE
jgi:hypothetical protein